MDDALRNLIDQNEIQAVLTLYTNMVDRREWQRMDDIFAPDATLDYVDTIGEAGFKFENPQAKSSCGCGTSFDV